MILHVDFYVLVLGVAGVIAGLLFVTAWRRPAAPSGRYLAFLMAALSVWAFTAAFEASAHSVPVKILWSKAEYLGISASPLLLFLSALVLSKRDIKLRSLKTLLLSIIPVSTFLLALTNEWHHLIWTGFSWAAYPAVRVLVYHHGFFFWVHAAYSYVLLILTTILLIGACVRSKDFQRRQTVALLCALPWPFLGNILLLTGATSSAGYDLTPVGFTVSGFFLLWVFYGLRFAELVPVARKKITEVLSESLIVLDQNGRIAAVNAAALRLFVELGVLGEKVPEYKVAGKSATEIFALWPELAEPLSSPGSGQKEILWRKDGRTRMFDLCLSPLCGRSGEVIGWVAFLYDITRLKEAEITAVQARRIAEALQKAGLILSSTLEIKQMSNIILDLLGHIIHFDAGAFLIAEDSEFRISGIRGVEGCQDLIGRKIPAVGPGVCGLVVQQKKPLIFDALKREDVLLPLPRNFDVHSYLGVPVILRDRVEGLLSLYAVKKKRFTDDDAAVVQFFASQLAITLQNSLLFDQMNTMATTDNLTGILNRRRFFEISEKEFERTRRYKRPLALILFDIDNFKEVNDSHGHLIGDQVLRGIAGTVSKSIRTVDTLCRFGGDEFLLILPETSLGEALGISERLRQKISELVVVTAAGQLQLTVSAGVAVSAGDPKDSLEKLVARADSAMYLAKSSDRDSAGE